MHFVVNKAGLMTLHMYPLPNMEGFKAKCSFNICIYVPTSTYLRIICNTHVLHT